MSQKKEFDESDLTIFKEIAKTTMTDLSKEFIEKNSWVVESTKSEKERTQFVLGTIGQGRFYYLDNHANGNFYLSSVPPNQIKHS